MAVYGPGCHPQYIIWTIYYFVGDRPVHKLPFGPKCHGLYITLNTCKSVRRRFFINCISKTKNEFGQNPEENIILIGPGQYTKILTGWANKDKYWSGSSSRQEAIPANCLIQRESSRIFV